MPFLLLFNPCEFFEVTINIIQLFSYYNKALFFLVLTVFSLSCVIMAALAYQFFMLFAENELKWRID